MSLKLKLYQLCNSFIENRHNTIERSIDTIETSLLSETKSSAGDKHETGRAMAQLEREKLGQQLVEINKIKQTLNRVKTIKTTNIVTIGSLVYTNQFNYYIAISAGEFIVNNNSFYAVSPNTPIGKLLIGKTIGDIILFKNKRINIIDVV